MYLPRPLALAAIVLLPLLAACSSLGLGESGSAAATLPMARAVDARTDDLAAMIFVLDVPAGVQPLPEGPAASFDAGGQGAAGQHVHAVLVLADGDAIDGQLPPPATGRTYYLFGLGDRDQTTLRAAQAWAGRQTPPPATSFSVTSRLCALRPADPTAVVSITPVLPGRPPLLPLASFPVGALAACRS